MTSLYMYVTGTGRQTYGNDAYCSLLSRTYKPSRITSSRRDTYNMNMACVIYTRVRLCHVFNARQHNYRVSRNSVRQRSK